MPCSIGRFLQKDPSPGLHYLPDTTNNGYAYSLNNSSNLGDPSGRSIFGDVFKFFSGAGGFLVDAISVFATAGLMIAAGAPVGGALLAISATAAGSAAIAAITAVVQGGSFSENFARNFHFNLRISLATLAVASALSFGYGGIVDAGASKIPLQGYIQTGSPILGLGGGLTIGSSAVMSGVSPAELIRPATTLTFAQHEFGHTVQFAGLSVIGAAAQRFSGGLPNANWYVLGAYGDLGVFGLACPGCVWESSASGLGPK